MDTLVGHKGTARRLLILALAGAVGALAQSDWRRIGGSSFEWRLASPATGPVERVWFSGDGATLYARTHASKVLKTSDFENWEPAPGATDPPPLPAPQVARLPDQGVHLVTTASAVYALGRHVFRSEDGGHAWDNLTAYKAQSVIGGGQHDLAVWPGNPNQLVVANDFGVWRSMDGGLSWTGLNQMLPNLEVRRILTAASGAPLQVQAGSSVLELPPGSSVWLPAPAAALQAEAAQLQRYASVAGAPELRTSAAAGDTIYAGSADGRIWKSIDGGRSFERTAMPAGTAGEVVERIFVDPTEPRVALAALSGAGPHVLRTVNGGEFWDVLDANLPPGSAYGITAERAAGAVYVATEKGVFYAVTDLENASSPADVKWTNLAAALPEARATDVRLDPAGVQLYAAVDGYGVFATAAPHRLRSLRIVNAADLSARPAAPGSLLSVIGGRLTGVRGGNLDYPVLVASDGASQIQVPFEAVGPDVVLELQTALETVVRHLPVQPISPAILVPEGVPAIYDADSGMPLDARNAAHSGGRIQIMTTGLGKVRPNWPTGLAAPLENPPAVVAPVRAYLDRTPVEVTRATLAPGFIGFYLIEVQLPTIANFGDAELYISAGGQESNRVRVSIVP